MNTPKLFLAIFLTLTTLIFIVLLVFTGNPKTPEQIIMDLRADCYRTAIANRKNDMFEKCLEIK